MESDGDLVKDERGEGAVMAKGIKRRSIGARIFGAMLVMTVIAVFTIVCGIGALRTIGDYNEVIGDACLGMERANGQLAASTQKMQMYAALIHYEQMGDTSLYYRDLLKKANESVQTYGAELHNLADMTGDENLIAVANTYLLSVSDLSECAIKLIAAVEKFDRDTFTQEATKLSGYVNDMMEKEAQFGTALDTYCDFIMNRSAVKISGTYTFDMIMCGIIIIVAAAELFIVAKTVSGPAKKSRTQVDDIVKKIENDQGDLTERITVSSNDEIGQMAVGVNNFIEQLQVIMRKLKKESENLKNSALAVNNEVGTSNESASSVSAAMEEMSASMEEISATLGQIASGSDSIMTQIEQMNSHVQDGVRLVRDITNRADEMHHDTLESKEATADNVENIRKDLSAALTDSRSVEKINELTQDILGISSQTNLLSLNASIEAARAGDAGRGFAVVADEIRGLADSSAATASNIQSISATVTEAVERLAKNAEAMLKFVDQKVMKDYDTFVEVVDQYQQDAESVNDILNEFAGNAGEIAETMKAMNTGISDISIAVDESAKGVTSVADNAVSLVEAINQIQAESENSKNISQMLSDEVERFKKV